MTEREYRSLPCDSYSTLKDFEADRKKYYKKYILKEKLDDEDEQESKASLIGSLTDCLLLNPENFDDKFYISSCVSQPTGLMLQFVESLYKKTILSCNEDGILTKQFDLLLKEAYDDVKYDVSGNIVAFKRDSFETVVGKFSGDIKAYYDEMLAVRPTNKTIVTPNDIELAERLKLGLKNNFVTNQVISLESNSRFEVYNQLICQYEYKGLQLKSMLDKVIVDNENKTIQPYDLKVTWNVDNFTENYYLYRKSYLQAKLYNIAVYYQFRNLVDLDGYTILPMKFIVADSLNYMNPLIYELTSTDLAKAKVGFEYKNRSYRGLDEIIEDLEWHKSANIWNMSRSNYDKRGLVNLNIKYE